MDAVKIEELKNKIWKCFWVGNFFLQFFLFKSYCNREIIKFIPENMDQVGYLDVTYKIYDLILQGDIVQGGRYALENGVNSGMMLIGAINLFVFGFSRFSVLIPNFLGLFLCEIAGVRSLSRITSSRFIGLVYYGILMMTQAIFAAVGGMFDYRWDFLAFCLYTIWLVYLVEYLYSGKKEPFYCSAIAGGILLFIRLNTVLYLGIILFAVVVLKIVTQHKGQRKTSLIEWCNYLGVLILAGGWYLILCFENFFNYYFSALFTNSSREAWKIHMNMQDNLLFYPKLLWQVLMGGKQIMVICILSVISVCLLWINKNNILKKRKSIFFVLILSWVVPYLILTVMDNKNSAAAMILIGPLLIYPVLLLGEVKVVDGLWKRIIQIVVSVVVIVGIGDFALSMMSAYPHHTKEDAQGYVYANEIIAEYMEENDMDSAEIVFDRLLSCFFPQTIQVYSREEKERSISIAYAIPSMKEDYLMSMFDIEEIQMGLGNAHFLVINRAQYSIESSFNTDNTLEKHKEILIEYAEENMYLIGKIYCEGNELEIYAKPIIEIRTEWSDWLGKNNTDIIIKNVQEEMGFLVLEGEYGYSLDGLSVNATNCEGELITTNFVVENSKYKIVMDIRECNLDHDVIHLEFDNYFVPSDVLESLDTRSLTVYYPTKIYYQKE